MFYVFHFYPIFVTTWLCRILFKDKEQKWDEIETKLQAEHDSLLLKSSNKVMNLLKACETDRTVIFIAK